MASLSTIVLDQTRHDRGGTVRIADAAEGECSLKLSIVSMHGRCQFDFLTQDCRVGRKSGAPLPAGRFDATLWSVAYLPKPNAL